MTPAGAEPMINADVLKAKAIAAIMETIDAEDPADAKQALALIRSMLGNGESK